jgi:hypothetical protein
VNDNRYELQEDFFVNVTATDANTINLPINHFIVLINDDDRLTIHWESSAYTVKENAGQSPFCLIMQGRPATTIAAVNLRAEPDTAIPDVDYKNEGLTVIFHPERTITGAGSTGCKTIGEVIVKCCFNLTIISDIAFEENKRFYLVADLNPTERISIDGRASVDIIDFNVVVDQQPGSATDGLAQLININPPNGTVCRVGDSGAGVSKSARCDSTDQSLSLDLNPCNASIQLQVRDENGTSVLSNALGSRPEPYVIRYSLEDGSPEDKRELNVSLQVVTSNGMPFYIVELKSSDNLTLPLSAIPLESEDCPQNNPDNNPDNDSEDSAASMKASPVLMPLAVILGIVSASR